ncbi:hypothetical protein ACHAWF_007709 [Thalassiosira exigua]
MAGLGGDQQSSQRRRRWPFEASGSRGVLRVRVAAGCALLLLLILASREYLWSASVVVAPDGAARPAASGGVGSAIPYGEVDDLTKGKSCVYRKSPLKSPLRIGNPWSCQECSAEGGGCRPIRRRRGRCAPFSKYLGSGYGEIPRSYAAFSPFTSSKSATMVYHHDGRKKYAREYPSCGASLSPPCFDLSRCEASFANGTPALRVYSYGGMIDGFLDFAAQQRPGLVERVDDPDDACLLVAGEGSFDGPGDMLGDRRWNGGRNHYIDSSDRLFGSHRDRPFNDKVSFGVAAVAASNMDDAWLREGYDVPLIYYPLWERPKGFGELDPHRPRRYLLSFKGNIYQWEQRSWQHRWLAAEYWHGEPDVHVDAKCRNRRFAVQDYENAQPEDYGNLLLNSTFFFCPGGGGINSFRFAEVLIAGAIPVVTSDFLTPFHPDVDWSGCVVRVSDARVVDAPRIVREIGAEEVRERQRTCARLVDSVFGKDLPNHLVRRHMFSVAMGIWSVRIRNALGRRDGLESLVASGY